MIIGSMVGWPLLTATGKNREPIFIGGGPRRGTRTLIKLHANQEVIKAEMWADNEELIKEKIPY